MVDFVISAVKIRNFRGMRDIKIDIPDGRIITIIGQNNSGKSNLLEAISLCLSPRIFSSYQIKETDFWQSQKGMSADFFEIEIIFTPTTGAKLPVLRDGEGKLTEVKGIKIYAELDGLEAEQYLINNNNDRIFWGRKYATPIDIDQWLPDVWYLTPNNLEKDYKKWKENHIHQLLKNYKDEFLSTSATDLIKDYSNLRKEGLKTKYWTEKVEPKLKKEISFFTGNNRQTVIKPSLENLDNWLWKGLTLSVVSEDDWPAITHQQLGKGWKSILRLSALSGAKQLTEKNKSIFLCIDEPGAYLTPFKQRKLRQYLINLVKKNNQIILATNSDLMVNDQTNQKIIRLKMTKSGVEKNEFEGKIPASINQNNGELILARKVVFNLTGKIKIEEEVDWDETETVYVKNNDIEEVAKQIVLLQTLGIQWCALIDNKESILILEKQQSLYDKIIEIDEKIDLKSEIEKWINSQWQAEETLIIN